MKPMKWMRLMGAVAFALLLGVTSPGGVGAQLPPSPQFVEADAAFMRAMIAHHGQALEMAELVATRAERAEIRYLARRIRLSQEMEISLMRRWLEKREETRLVAEPAEDGGRERRQTRTEHAGHVLAGSTFPGMISVEEMTELAGLSGSEFDRRFLTLMIRHHEGALAMVAHLFASPGAGQESAIFNFASHVDADQRIEIDRMARLLRSDRR